MPLDGVALIPRWAERETHWLPADEERWRAYLGWDDEPREVVALRASMALPPAAHGPST